MNTEQKAQKLLESSRTRKGASEGAREAALTFYNIFTKLRRKDRELVRLEIAKLRQQDHDIDPKSENNDYIAEFFPTQTAATMLNSGEVRLSYVEEQLFFLLEDLRKEIESSAPSPRAARARLKSLLTKFRASIPRITNPLPTPDSEIERYKGADTEKASDFLDRVWGHWLNAKRLYRPYLRSIDPKLVKALEYQFADDLPTLAKLLPTQDVETDDIIAEAGLVVRTDSERRVVAAVLKRQPSK